MEAMRCYGCKGERSTIRLRRCPQLETGRHQGEVVPPYPAHRCTFMPAPVAAIGTGDSADGVARAVGVEQDMVPGEFGVLGGAAEQSVFAELARPAGGWLRFGEGGPEGTARNHVEADPSWGSQLP